MNVLFTICGRAGSKGVKNKNIKDFCGHPLVYYSLAAIRLYLDKFTDATNADVVLNTDSKELVELVAAQSLVSVEVRMRDESLGGDSVPKVAVIKDCMSFMVAKMGHNYDVVVDLDITSPLRTAEDVRNAIDRKMARLDTDVVYSVTGSRRNPYFNMVREEDGYFVKAVASSFTARQQAPVFYDMNASIYAYSPEALLNKPSNIFFNDKADAVFMKDTAVLDIDSEEDYEIMQVIAGYLYGKYSDYCEVRNAIELMGV